MPNFIKIGAHLIFRTKFRKFVILGQGYSFQLIYFCNEHIKFALSAKFHKNRAHCNFANKFAPVFNIESKYGISNTIFMNNKIDLLWVPNFIALGPNFFGMLVLMSNVCYLKVILIFLVVIARYLVFTGSYCLLPGCCLLSGGVTAHSHF